MYLKNIINSGNLFTNGKFCKIAISKTLKINNSFNENIYDIIPVVN